jgi:cytochrome c-type biogenesis protein CcmH/NrfG
VRTKASMRPDEAPPPPAGRRPVLRVTALGVFAAGFLLLLGAVAAVWVGQITAKPLAAWLSMGYSAGAFI